MNQPARTDAVVPKRFATNRAYTTLTVTSTLLRVALEYAQVDFGIDGCVSRKFHLHLVGLNSHCTNETGRPTSGKQLLRISTGSGNTGGRKLHIQAAIITAGDAAPPPA